MKRFAILILGIALAFLPVLAQAEATLTATGSATLTVTPDIAVLNVGYSCENENPSDAQAQTAAMISAIQEAALACGIAKEDIVTLSLNVSPVYNYAADVPSLRGYSVEHMLSVTVRQIDQVGEVLDALLSAGANQSYGINFSASKAEDVYLQALALAIDNAGAKADAMAIASGIWLGGISSVREVLDGVYYGAGAGSGSVQRYEATADAGLGSTVKAGEISVTATVEVIYEIR